MASRPLPRGASSPPRGEGEVRLHRRGDAAADADAGRQQGAIRLLLGGGHEYGGTGLQLGLVARANVTMGASGGTTILASLPLYLTVSI